MIFFLLGDFGDFRTGPSLCACETSTTTCFFVFLLFTFFFFFFFFFFSGEFGDDAPEMSSASTIASSGGAPGGLEGILFRRGVSLIQTPCQSRRYY